jgi:hypothetical protein
MGFYVTLKTLAVTALFVAGTTLIAHAQETLPSQTPAATAPAAGGMSAEDQALLEAVKRQNAQRKAAASAAGNAIRHDAQNGAVGDCTIVTKVKDHPEKSRAVIPLMPSATVDQMLVAMNKGGLKHEKVCGPTAALLWSKVTSSHSTP